MSPQVSEEDWNNDEQLVYLTYREMAVLVMAAKQVLALNGDAPELTGILEGATTKFMVELKPVLYDDDIRKLGLE